MFAPARLRAPPHLSSLSARSSSFLATTDPSTSSSPLFPPSRMDAAIGCSKAESSSGALSSIFSSGDPSAVPLDSTATGLSALSKLLISNASSFSSCSSSLTTPCADSSMASGGFPRGPTTTTTTTQRLPADSVGCAFSLPNHERADAHGRPDAHGRAVPSPASSVCSGRTGAVYSSAGPAASSSRKRPLPSLSKVFPDSFGDAAASHVPTEPTANNKRRRTAGGQLVNQVVESGTKERRLDGQLSVVGDLSPEELAGVGSLVELCVDMLKLSKQMAGLEERSRFDEKASGVTPQAAFMSGLKAVCHAVGLSVCESEVLEAAPCADHLTEQPCRDPKMLTEQSSPSSSSSCPLFSQLPPPLDVPRRSGGGLADLSQLLARTVKRQEERRKSLQKEQQKTLEALAASQAEVAACREELRRLREAAASYLYKQNVKWGGTGGGGWDDGFGGGDLFRRLPPDVY
eukprot:GHVS01040726.1.p1 GENE.GHVS01040726.1~~GHVS01040726.1.p1  ORF type:complete len:504 (+),score=139.54 GHVS01040726.1:130-1512(+)